MDSLLEDTVILILHHQSHHYFASGEEGPHISKRHIRTRSLRSSSFGAFA